MDKNRYQPLSTAINRYQPLSTAINRYQPLSTAINRYQPLSTAINRYQPLKQHTMSYTYAFEKLAVWKLNRQFTKRLYGITKSFPKEEAFGITSQIRRATISISCNLAEGSARISSKEQNRFYEIAFGSAVEVVNLMILSNDLEMLSDDDYASLRNEMEKITFDISTLIKNNRKS